jgi:hypothetical protein
VLNGAVDIARQALWKSVEMKQLDKARAERLLVNFEKAINYCHVYLHDEITGESAKMIKTIRTHDKTVLLGHQAQAVYFSMYWDDIHELNNQILEAEDALEEHHESKVQDNGT